MTVRIVTDSTSDLPPALASEYGIAVVPLTVRFGDEEFLDGVDITRTMIAVWILGVWALQLWWSTWWLERFRYGPLEWAWRCGTYRSWQPLRT